MYAFSLVCQRVCRASRIAVNLSYSTIDINFVGSQRVPIQRDTIAECN